MILCLQMMIKKEQKIDDIEYITFQPNTILYAIQKDSKLGETIDNAKYGIVFHTSYSESTIDDLTASFGVDILLSWPPPIYG